MLSVARTNEVRFCTSDIRIQGAMCGRIWWPMDAVCGIPIERAVIWNKGDTFEDALQRVLMDHGGDFQEALFTADTIVVIIRRYSRHKDRVVTHTKALPVLDVAWDLVDEEHFSYDFGGDE